MHCDRAPHGHEVVWVTCGICVPCFWCSQSSYRITHLDLSHNEFSEVAGVILGAALGELGVCGQKARGSLLCVACAVLLFFPSHTAESEVLQTLNLSWNHLRKKGAVAIAQGLKVDRLSTPYPDLKITTPLHTHTHTHTHTHRATRC